jgi:hypothetical protein
MKYISLNDYLKILKASLDPDDLNNKQHPEDIEIALEFTNRIIFEVLKALDKD